jgi:hypothetical protein
VAVEGDAVATAIEGDVVATAVEGEALATAFGFVGALPPPQLETAMTKRAPPMIARTPLPTGFSFRRETHVPSGSVT